MPAVAATAIPRRPLGRTGCEVTLFGLGGEGVLRTDGRVAEAVRVIQRALDQGVNYFDTAPAYSSSRDYYGKVLGELGERRKDIFLASKTHDRTRDGSLHLLDDSLKRLRTDYLDLWQLHDLRTLRDLDAIFARGGAMEALLEARAQKRVRFFGITGHHDPAILLEAMRRFDFDTVLVALNAADVHRASFRNTVLVEAARRNMGVIGMKVCAAGRLVAPGNLTMDQAMGYVLSQPGISNVIVGCWSPAEVDDNARIARAFTPFNEEVQRALEQRTLTNHSQFTYFKSPSARS